MINSDTIQIANAVLGFADEAQRNGFLVLDQKCNSKDCLGNKFLELVLGFVIDGMPDADIMQLTTNYIRSAAYTGENLVQAGIIIDGMLGIQAGISREMLAEILCSHFSVEDRNEFIDKTDVNIRKLG